MHIDVGNSLEFPVHQLEMKITVLAAGSRGDVQPFVAVGFGLQQAGHDVCLVSNAHFETWIRRYGLDFRPVRWDALATLQAEPAQQMIRSGRILALAKYFWQVAPRLIARLQVESWLACQDSDILFYGIQSFWGHAIAEKLDIPGLPGLLHPLIPTRFFPAQVFPVNLGGPLNWVTHYLTEQAFWQIIRRPTNTFRQRTLGLAPISFPGTLFSVLRQQASPLLCSLSPTITPKPPDWPPNVHEYGYWFLPAPPGWEPPPDLVEFITSGPPPVYVGFGSMANQRAEETTHRIVEALRLAGQRGVLAGGWGSLRNTDFSKDIFFVDEVPHDWLFPHLAAVVHHGGAGTTAAGLRAGVPAVVVPHMQDQPYWGRRLWQLGVSPKPLPLRHLTAETLAQCIRIAVYDQSMQARARWVGQKIRTEEGVKRTIKVFDRLASCPVI